MSVIERSCTLPSDKSPGCACAPKDKTGNKVAGASTAAALAAAACTACCILPFTLPATLLAFAGSAIAILDHAHRLMTLVAAIIVGGAWIWIAWRRRRTGRQIAGSTFALMVLATLLTAGAASWPLIEPIAFNTLGIVKKKVAPTNE